MRVLSQSTMGSSSISNDGRRAGPLEEGDEKEKSSNMVEGVSDEVVYIIPLRAVEWCRWLVL